MSARSFRSVFMVASCAGAALGCYLVSLRVASERAALQDVETQIVMAERDIRLLETEIGTRGRLAQLERWNVRVLELSAPSADQFLDGGFALARLMRPEPRIDLQAPVVLASASADAQRPTVPDQAETPAEAETAQAQDLLHVASLKLPARGEAGTERDLKAPAKSGATPQAVEKKAGDKQREAASRPMTKPVRTASVDPLAPLAASSSRTGKDNDPAR